MAESGFVQPPANSIVKGCVGLFIKDNRVVVSASDFELQSYGGYTLYDSQKHRVREALSRAVLRAYCNPIVSDVLDSYQCYEWIQRVTNRKESGAQMVFIPIGHPGEEGS